MQFLDLFKHETDTLNFKVGEFIIKLGEPVTVMYILVEGEAEVRLGDTTLYRAKPGDLLGELGLIDHAPSSADVIAKTPCKLVPIGERRFLFLVQQTPNFAIGVMKVIADRLRRMNSRV